MIETEEIDGSGPLLVFLHEGLGSLSSWRDFPHRLAKATGLPALITSRVGYGRSSPRPRPWPISFLQDEARALELPDDAILFGHSDGASIALYYAERRPVRGLILEAPHLFVEEVCLQSIARLGDEVRRKLARHHDRPDELFAGWTGVWLDPAFRSWRIAAPRVPALVIQGEDDEYGTLAQVDAAQPTERLILAHCGHAPHRDHPDKVIAASSAFIQQLLRAPSPKT